MSVDPEQLTEDIIYQSAQVPRSIPFENIKCVGFSLQNFNNLELLTKITSLRIVSFKICNLKTFPSELFQIPTLLNIDLSGNALTALPDDENDYKKLPNLRLLNLSENSIADLSEIFKLKYFSGLKHLFLKGNVCFSSPDSFDQTVSNLPSLLILNDVIITSQYRGVLQNIVKDPEISPLQFDQIDNYITLYVKYMRTSVENRALHRSNAEFFSLSKVIRKFSCVEKIQSVFRGYIVRKQYLKMKRSVALIKTKIKRWYKMRMSAANKIQAVYLHYRLREKIKFIKNARKIQSIWRKFKTREECLTLVFENNNKIDFFITESHLKLLKDYLEKHNLEYPDREEKSNFYILKQSEPIPQRLPGSPLVYYVNDKSALIRQKHFKDISHNSIWCGHNHQQTEPVVKVSEKGVNYAPKCPFQSIPYNNYSISNLSNRKSSRISKHEALINCEYSNPKVFTKIIRMICADRDILSNARIRFFNKKAIISTSAYLVVQSTIRCFVYRMRHFSELKRIVLEKRAAKCIKKFFKTSISKKVIKHSLEVMSYFRSIPMASSYFVSQNFLDKVNTMKIQFKCNFGFSVDKFLKVDPKSAKFPQLFVPIGKFTYMNSDLLSLFTLGVIKADAIPPMFYGKIPAKLLRTSKILKLTFKSPNEARSRIALYSYLTCDYSSVMTAQQVLPYCASNIIKYSWIAHSLRNMMTHLSIQNGKKIRFNFLMKRSRFSSNQSAENKESKDSINIASSQLSKGLSLDEEIMQLRGQYHPWKRDVKNYIEWCKNHPELIQKLEAISISRYEDYNTNTGSKKDEEKQEPTPSMLNLGLVDNDSLGLKGELKEAIYVPKSNRSDAFPESVYGDNISNKSPSNINNNLSTLKRSSALMKKRSLIIKPSLADIRFPPPPTKFEIELETQKIFRPPLSQLQSRHMKNKPIKFQQNYRHSSLSYRLKSTIKDWSVFPVNRSKFQSDNFSKLQTTNSFNSQVFDSENESIPFPTERSDVIVEEDKKDTPISSYSDFTPKIEKHVSNTKSIEFSKPINKFSVKPEVFDDGDFVPDDYEYNNDLSTNGSTSTIVTSNESFNNISNDSEIKKLDSINHLTFSNNSLDFSDPDFTSNEPSSRIDPSLSITNLESTQNTSISINLPKTSIGSRSTQRSKHTTIEQIKEVFARLVRLHQIGVELEHSAYVTSTMEQRFLAAEEVRNGFSEAKKERVSNAEKHLNDLKMRNSIEKAALKEKYEKIKKRISKTRTRNAKQVRSTHDAIVSKFNNNKKFALAFVSMSRKVSMQCEKAHLELEKAKDAAGVAQAASSIKSKAQEARTNYKIAKSEIQRARQDISAWDKIVIERRKQKAQALHEVNKKKVVELANESRQRIEKIRSFTKKPRQYVYIQPANDVETDTIAYASNTLESYIGANLGMVEAELLSTIINQIIE